MHVASALKRVCDRLGIFYVFYLFNALGYVCGGPLPCQVLLSRWFDKTRGYDDPVPPTAWEDARKTGIYVRDRWRPTEKLTVNAGLRAEYFPLMTRANGRGLEVVDYSTMVMSLGGVGSVPKDVGLKLTKWYLEPRLGASYRIDQKTAVRAGYGMTRNPLPWSRPMRGSFPFDVNFNATAEQYGYVTTLANGIPTVVLPDMSSGTVKLPSGVFVRSPNKGNAIYSGSGSGLNRAKIRDLVAYLPHPWTHKGYEVGRLVIYQRIPERAREALLMVRSGIDFSCWRKLVDDLWQVLSEKC